MKITRHVMAFLLATTYAAFVQCPPMVEFKPEEVREVFRPETKPERFTEELNRDPIGFLKALDGHIDANIKTLPPEQLNRVTDMMLDSVRMMQNPALKAESLKNGLDIISKINIMDPTLKAQRIVKGLGIAAETGVDASVKSPIIAKGLETLAKNNLLTQPVLAENPSFVATLKNVLQTFKNRAATVMQSTGAVAEQSKTEMRTSAENIMSMFNATESATALHDIIFDTAVDLMGISDKQGSLINNKNRAQLISATSRLITAQAIQGKTEQQVLNQITRMENIILKFADATSMLTDPERKALSTLQNAIGQYNFPLPSHAPAIASLKAKINLIEAFNSGKAQESIPNLSADAFTQAFSVLTPLDNGRTFVDVFFDKLLATDRGTFKFDQMKPEQREALFKAVTDIKTLQKLGKNSIELFRPNGPIEQTLKSIWNEKNPQSKGNNAIEALDRLTLLMNSTKDQQIKTQLRVYATAMIDALKSVKIADIQAVHLPTLASSIDRMINLYKDNKDFVSNLIDFATAKANSLVSENNLKAAQELIKSGKATEQQKADIASKEAQNESNIGFITNMLSSLMKNTALTADQVSSLTYATQTLLNRISEPQILAKVAEIFGKEWNSFPGKIKNTLFAQIINRLEYVPIEKAIFDQYIEPTLTKQFLADPKAALNIISDEVLAKLAQSSEQVKNNLNSLIDTWSKQLPDDLSLATKTYVALKRSNIDNAKLDAFYEKLFNKLITPETAQNPLLKKSGLTLLNYTYDTDNYPSLFEQSLTEKISLINKTLNFLASCTRDDFANNANNSATWNSLSLAENVFFQAKGNNIQTSLIIDAIKAMEKVVRQLNIAEKSAASDRILAFKVLATRVLRQAAPILDSQGKLIISRPQDLLNASINFITGDPVFQGGLVSLKDVYRTTEKSGGQKFVRYEMLGDTEQTILTALTLNAQLSTQIIKNSFNALKNQIELIKKTEKKAGTISQTEKEVMIALDSFLGRLKLIEAFQDKTLVTLKPDSLKETLQQAFSEFPVQKTMAHGTEQGPFQSFAHYFIGDMLPEILKTGSQEQIVQVLATLTDPIMQSRLPVNEYINLLKSNNMLSLIKQVGLAGQGVLSKLSKSFNNLSRFSFSIDAQARKQEEQNIKDLQTYIADKTPRPIASTSKSTEL